MTGQKIMLCIVIGLLATASYALEIKDLVYYDEDDQVVKHTYYTLQYNEDFEQADWVAYKLTAYMATTKVCERLSYFRKDPLVETESANHFDYTNSGYSRGHPVPAADMHWDDTAMWETFYASNISPQKQPFNNGIWKDLEEQVRDWAEEYEEIFVVCGPIVFENSCEYLEKGGVAIPEMFFKVVLDYEEPKAIGFVMMHEDSDLPLESFAVPVDFVETITGLDFFHTLDDETESEIESECHSFFE